MNFLIRPDTKDLAIINILTIIPLFGFYIGECGVC